MQDLRQSTFEIEQVHLHRTILPTHRQQRLLRRQIHADRLQRQLPHHPCVVASAFRRHLAEELRHPGRQGPLDHPKHVQRRRTGAAKQPVKDQPGQLGSRTHLAHADAHGVQRVRRMPMEPHHDFRLPALESRDVRHPGTSSGRGISPEIRSGQRRCLRQHRHPDRCRPGATVGIRHDHLHRLPSGLIEGHRCRKGTRARPVPRGQIPFEPVTVIQAVIGDGRHQHAGLAPVHRQLAAFDRHLRWLVRHRDPDTGDPVNRPFPELRRSAHRHQVRAALAVLMLECPCCPGILPQLHRPISKVRHITDRSRSTPRHHAGHVHRPQPPLREPARSPRRHLDLLHFPSAVDRVEDLQELLGVEHWIMPGDALSKPAHQRMHTCVRRVQARRGTKSTGQARDWHRAVAGHVPEFHFLVHPELVRWIHRQRSIRRMDQQRRAVRHLFRIEGRHPRHAHHDVRFRRPRHQSPTDPQLPDRVRRRPESHDVMHLDVVGILPVIADGLGRTERVRVATCRVLTARQALDGTSG